VIHTTFKSKIFWKVLFSFILVSLVTISAVFFYLAPTLQTKLELDLKQKLSTTLLHLRGSFEVVELSTENRELIDRLVDQLSRKNLVDISVLDEKGHLLGDSDSEVSSFVLRKEDELQSVEFIGAQRHEMGEIVRPDQNGVRHLYLTLRLSHGYLRIGTPLESVYETQKIVMRSLALSFLPALFLTVLLGTWLARKSSRPIQNLLDLAGHLSRGKFDVHFYKEGDDEINNLGELINHMAMSLEDRLRESIREKQQLTTMLNSMLEGVLVTNQLGEILLANQMVLNMFNYLGDYKDKSVLECFRNSDLHDNILKVIETGKPLANKILMQTAIGEKYVIIHSAPLLVSKGPAGTVTVISDISEVRKLETFRREFVANVSHELKTPLTSIRGYAETLQGGALEDPAAAHRFLGKILHNATQLQNLVEDLLELSAIESERVPVNKIKVGIECVVKDLKADYADMLLSKGLSLETDIPVDLETWADVNAFKQILRNLLDNAMKYTSSGGVIRIRAGQNETVTWVSVKDTGIGISNKDLERIFERFYRVDKSRSKEMGGTGLGLSIVKHLVASQGWDIKVESQVGVGSDFKIFIPHKIDKEMV